MDRALRTDRLELVPWQAPHARLLEQLMALPEMMRFVGTGRPLGPADVAERASFAAAHWLARGWGWRVPVLRDGGTPIGVIAANRLGEGTAGFPADEHEIGWFVAPAHQGRGLAVEAAGAVLDELLGPVGAPSVIARIQPANAASIRVAEALGMTFERATTGRLGEPIVVHRRHA